ncbi:MAG: hypothetical protein H7Y86_13420 [Rhizobacter sp.]|nr:hypothetical protein [Ferruginibacter sp.]
MKKLMAFISLVIIIQAAYSQHVGIGTAAPTEKLEVDGNLKMTNNTKGVVLNDADAPIITRGFDAFTGGAYQGIGRWGLFMQPNRLTMGIPALFGKAFNIATFAENSSVVQNMFSVNSDGNVGIGTEFPVGKFHIMNDSTLLSVLPNGNIGINSIAASSKLYIRGSHTVSPFSVNTPTGASVLRINAPMFGSFIEVGGDVVGILSALSVSNRHISPSSPQFKISTVHDQPLTGSSARLLFDNINNTNAGYQFTASSGSNESLHNFSLTQFNSSIGTRYLLHFNAAGNLGLGNINPAQKLTVTGSVNSSALSGSGVRAVKADATGTLITTPVTGYVSVPAASFIKINATAGTINYVSVGDIGVSLTTGSIASIFAPVSLPHGAVVSNLKVIYRDNSAENFSVIFGYTSQAAIGTIPLGVFTSAGNVATTQTSTVAISATIDNNTRTYYVRALPATGTDTWDGDLLYIKAVIFEYQL